MTKWFQNSPGIQTSQIILNGVKKEAKEGRLAMLNIKTHFKTATVKMWYGVYLTDKWNRASSHEIDLG